MIFDTTQSPTTKNLIAVIISAFLITFILARLLVYLILAGYLPPELFLTFKGVHIHHFTYGVIILSIVGLYLILKRPPVDSRRFKLIVWFFGICLGLTFDEFGMWVRLEDDYWIRQSYDAIIIVGLLLLNIAYYRPVMNWMKELFRIND